MKSFLKKVYNVVPFKKQMFGLVRFIHVPKERIYQHLHFKGIIKVKVSEEKSFKVMNYGHLIENQIFWKGLNHGFEKHSMRIWQLLCKDADVILDIGANTGIYSLVTEACGYASKVYAFEPVKRVFDRLDYNIKLNNYSTQVECVAISDKTGKAIIYDSINDNPYSVTVNKNMSPGTVETFKVEIDTITLDQFVETNNIENIDLIKLDVETHEVEALEGFKKYLNKFQPSFLIEILGDEIANGVSELIKDIDYVYFNIDENSGIKEVDTLSKSDYYNFLLCKEEQAVKVRKMYGL